MALKLVPLFPFTALAVSQVARHCSPCLWALPFDPSSGGCQSFLLVSLGALTVSLPTLSGVPLNRAHGTLLYLPLLTIPALSPQVLPAPLTGSVASITKLL